METCCPSVGGQRTEWKQRCSLTQHLSCRRMFHPSGSSVSCGSRAVFISNKASNCPPSSPLSRTRPAGSRTDSQQQPPSHPEPINRSPPRMFPSEWAAGRGGEGSYSTSLTTRLSSCPPATPPQCDLICLVISGLACSAQLHSKVKLDKGIGASPCKTASP